MFVLHTHWAAKLASAKPVPISRMLVGLAALSSRPTVVHGTFKVVLQLGHLSGLQGDSSRLLLGEPVLVSYDFFAVSLAEYAKVSLSIAALMARHGIPVAHNSILPYRMQSDRKFRGFSMKE